MFQDENSQRKGQGMSALVHSKFLNWSNILIKFCWMEKLRFDVSGFGVARLSARPADF